MNTTKRSIKNFKLLIQIHKTPRNYSYKYPETSFSDLDGITLFNLVGDNENFLSSPKSEFLEICTELSSRLAQTMDIPLKKVGMKKAPKYTRDGKLIDGILEDKKMYFVRYSLDDYLKFRDEYKIGNYFFTIAHENRHAYQTYKFKNFNKNEPDYTFISFMRNEKLMRDYLLNFGDKNQLASDDYTYDSLERDANYFAISLYMDLVKDKKADISIANLEDLITEMLDFNEAKNGTPASRKQIENFARIYTKFKNCIGLEAYEKLAEKYDLENGQIISDAINLVQEREQNMNSYLVDGLKLYYDFVKKLLPNGYSQEKFDEHIKNGTFKDLYDEMVDILDNSGFSLSPNMQVKKPLTRDNVFEYLF
ncbi:MAG: hypothetical protein IJX17_06715 [Clostridia bacterium]|nr:hypothetical protein [Clostridia bacterium]